MKIFLTIIGISFSILIYSQTIEIIPLPNNATTSSKRGLFQVNEKVTWACGTDGVIMKTKKDKWITVTQDTFWNHLDFRDVHAFNKNEAIIMSSGKGCDMYKTQDGGDKWTLVYKNYREGIFFDGMDFWSDGTGIAFSDPIDDKIFLIVSSDKGQSWKELNPITLPKVLTGEAGFAASGTGIVCVGDSTVYIGTGGGATARVFISHDRGLNWKVVETPMMSGEASGIYSMAFIDELNGVAVGGNYLDSTNTEGNCIITSNGGETWKKAKVPPTGYRSCVAYNGNGVLIAVGRTGVDVSFNKGKKWQHISDDAYYSCVIQQNTGWLTGKNGKMAKLQIID